MLRALAIRDIVLIDRLELAFAGGLCVLTGETGAGKSILLDALGLALGARADSGLVRHGAEQGSVAAAFDIAADHPARALLAEQDIAGEDELVLRRVIGADGRSRAFVDDQPVSVGLLRRLGALLVEMHGQNEEQGLLDAGVHRSLLDAYAGLAPLRARVGSAFAAMQTAAAAAATCRAEGEAARRDEDYLRHVKAELDLLAPQADEEAALAAMRTLLMHGEKVAAALAEATGAMEEGGGVASRLRVASRALLRVAERAGGKLDAALAALDRAETEVAEAASVLDRAVGDLDLDPGRLERTEERLFALRAAARKHGCAVADLPKLAADFAARLAAIDSGSATLGRLEAAAAQARTAYAAAARELSAARQTAARRFDKAVAKELGPLKLGQAKFLTDVAALAESEWSADGIDRVSFLIATIPGAPPAPLGKIASGGELSRFMLALKVVLAAAGSAPTLVFDEVDRGVGGATAAAVGERLARLAGKLQVLVVTHSPQVAARGMHHWRIAKRLGGNGRAAGSAVDVDRLDDTARQEEIARMLAGASVTEQARAAAASLLQGSRP
ncbi:MAG TPA: DNA repair protein RecN [Candidatus Sulfotelmatobacter sp.]|nr:DNA repair protein RecN [Candidatus Sulfotelmatobacter sp.]